MTSLIFRATYTFYDFDLRVLFLGHEMSESVDSLLYQTFRLQIIN